jgi:hypothetical protein
MVIKCTKLYDPVAYGLASILPPYKVFLLRNATTLTFELWLWKTTRFFLSWWWLCGPGVHSLVSTLPTRFLYQEMLWPWSLSSDLDKQSLLMVIKYTKLYDPRVHGWVSIRPSKSGHTDRWTTLYRNMSHLKTSVSKMMSCYIISL